jgi:hypothetical protein
MATIYELGLAAFARAKYFAINVLTADQRELSQRFSSTVADKFDGAEQASRRTMCRPTRRPFRGRLTHFGEMSQSYQTQTSANAHQHDVLFCAG